MRMRTRYPRPPRPPRARREIRVKPAGHIRMYTMDHTQRAMYVYTCSRLTASYSEDVILLPLIAPLLLSSPGRVPGIPYTYSTFCQ